MLLLKRLPTLICLPGLALLTALGVSSADGQLHHFAVEADGGGPIGSRPARTPFFIQVLAQDSTNGTISSFSGTVEITSDGPLTAGGGTTASFSGGILSSHSVTFGSGGFYTITATLTAGAETGVSDTFTITNPLPQIGILTPSARTAGDTGFTLGVSGSGFTPVSEILFGGSALPTTFVSDSSLSAFVAAVFIDTAGTVPVTVASPSPGGGTSGQAPFTVQDPVLRARLLLEGPHAGGGTMSTQLRTDNVIPGAHPYAGPPWNHAGAESVAVVPAGVVDWVLVSLRTGTSAATTVASRAAFLMSDGSLVDLDGASPVSFGGIGLGSRYVVVRHRNHIGAMTATPRPLDAPVDSCDFTTGPSAFFGGGGKPLGGGVWGLHAGDFSGDEFIDAADFTGPDNQIFQSGYRRADLNLDGFIDAADFAPPDNNIFAGSTVPN